MQLRSINLRLCLVDSVKDLINTAFCHEYRILISVNILAHGHFNEMVTMFTLVVQFMTDI